jgi:hypothetical protein
MNYQFDWSWKGWTSTDRGGNSLQQWLSFGRAKSNDAPKVMALYATVGPLCAALSWESPVVRLTICAVLFGVCCLGFALSPHWLDVLGMLGWGLNMAFVVQEHEEGKPS